MLKSELCPWSVNTSVHVSQHTEKVAFIAFAFSLFERFPAFSEAQPSVQRCASKTADLTGFGAGTVSKQQFGVGGLQTSGGNGEFCLPPAK